MIEDHLISYKHEDKHHVYPTFGKPHEVDGKPCWCEPKVDPEYPSVIIHNEEN